MVHQLRADICIAGAGIIGLSLALELRVRGLSVIVLDAAPPMREASMAAAGMLAVDDPHNPPELSSLSRFSASLYPGYLQRIAQLSGIAVPFQTSRTLQATRDLTRASDAPLSSTFFERIALSSHPVDEPCPPSGFTVLREYSIDPRQLASSLIGAVSAASIRLIAGEPVVSTHTTPGCVAVTTPAHTIEATNFVDCTGAWASDPAFQIIPIKGQMLAVAIPKDLSLGVTIRTPDIYIVPRTTGPNAGRAIIGATLEDAGFDKTVHASQISRLHRSAAALLPQLSDTAILDAWSGLRPATPDRLPMLGAHPRKPLHWLASGHYRNGILLAPATARVMAALLLGEAPPVYLQAFSPSRAMLRHKPEDRSSRPADIRPRAN